MAWSKLKEEKILLMILNVKDVWACETQSDMDLWCQNMEPVTSLTRLDDWDLDFSDKMNAKKLGGFRAIFIKNQ